MLDRMADQVEQVVRRGHRPDSNAVNGLCHSPAKDIRKVGVVLPVRAGLRRERITVDFQEEHPVPGYIRGLLCGSGRLFRRIRLQPVLQECFVVRHAFFRRDQEILICGEAEIRLRIQVPADQSFHHQRGQSPSSKKPVKGKETLCLDCLQISHPHRTLLIRRQAVPRDVISIHAVRRVQDHRQDMMLFGEAKDLFPHDPAVSGRISFRISQRCAHQ